MGSCYGENNHKQHQNKDETIKGLNPEVNQQTKIFKKEGLQVQERNERKVIQHKQGSIIPIDPNISEIYQKELNNHRFEYTNGLINSLAHKLKSQALVNNERVRKELSKIGELLPCSNTNSIFVKANSQKFDEMVILISGTKGTPYSSGLYHFELVCGANYPNQPPKMQLTTGNGRVRFNPNLYENGYVCLSLLGTWRGQANEQWTSISTLLQVYVSIQSLVMTQDIYFNEPGYETTKGTPHGQLQNEGYSNIVKIANIRYAMIDVMKSPPIGFQQIVKRHFLIKKEEILAECYEWLKNAGNRCTYVGCQNHKILDEINKKGYAKLLEQQINHLKDQLNVLSQDRQ